MRKWSSIAVGVNLLLGIPGVVPVWLLWYFAANWPLAAMGWAQRNPTENDGMLPWLLFGAPVLALFALVWWLSNRPVRRRAALDPRLYWPVSALVTLVPSFTLMIVL
ncbi:alkaline shock response membrane anchor protein AmaP [Streptomyces sp. R-74717]|uniref:hypothetical protein n=1 Tax=Streptomyces TaxID=1883 RepID=UPI00224FAB13|nr:hypothetical protein [Streptomyces atratus]MCX5340617.1 alkaline shock response membrane anchor protein AmaP [Streptomyces atratus]